VDDGEWVAEEISPIAFVILSDSEEFFATCISVNTDQRRFFAIAQNDKREMNNITIS
jgi:hypothetical protein